MTLSDYEELKNRVIISISDQENYVELLSELKNMFTKEISSKRRLESIKTINELLEVLELRGVLSEDNVGHLKSIHLKFPYDKRILQEILQYESNHVPRGLVNIYESDLISNTSQDFNSTLSSNSLYGISPKKKKIICDRLSEELGTFWRDLARNLGIREGLIEEIDKKYLRTSDKVNDILERYETRSDPQRWFYGLCDALQNARRRDLSKALHEIMTYNI